MIVNPISDIFSRMDQLIDDYVAINGEGSIGSITLNADESLQIRTASRHLPYRSAHPRSYKGIPVLLTDQANRENPLGGGDDG